MLARFVVPAARLDEFATAARTARAAGDGPWPLSVLATAADAGRLEAFDATQADIARVEMIEAKAEDDAAIGALASAYAPRRVVYVEIPIARDPSALIAALRQHGLRAKVRTGGVTADAFPSPDDLLRFLVRCVEQGVPFKATAGLHHPLRGEYALTYASDAPRGMMYGFLNVFLAALLLREGHAAERVRPLLEERDSRAIVAAVDGISWNGLRVDESAIAAARAAFAGSFGSCSFEEPVQDLQALSLLPPLA